MSQTTPVLCRNCGTQIEHYPGYCLEDVIAAAQEFEDFNPEIGQELCSDCKETNNITSDWLIETVDQALVENLDTQQIQDVIEGFNLETIGSDWEILTLEEVYELTELQPDSQIQDSSSQPAPESNKDQEGNTQPEKQNKNNRKSSEN